MGTCWASCRFELRGFFDKLSKRIHVRNMELIMAGEAEHFGITFDVKGGRRTTAVLTREQANALGQLLLDQGLVPLPDNETWDQRYARASAYIDLLEACMRD